MISLAPVFAGQTVLLSSFLSSKAKDSQLDDPFIRSVQLTTAFISISGVAVLALYNEIMKNYEEQQKLLLATTGSSSSGAAKPVKKQKPKLSMTESVKFLLSSPYLGCIAILVIAYGLAINFTEVMWKAQVLMLFCNYRSYFNE